MYMLICTCTYFCHIVCVIHVHVHVCMYSICTCTCMCLLFMYMCTYTCICVHVQCMLYVFMCKCPCVCMCLHVHMCVSLCVCVIRTCIYMVLLFFTVKRSSARLKRKVHFISAYELYMLYTVCCPGYVHVFAFSAVCPVYTCKCSLQYIVLYLYGYTM